MQHSFHTAPTKPEKGTKSNTDKVEKRDRGGQAHDEKPKPNTETPTPKKH